MTFHTFTSSKLLSIRFEINGFIKIYDGVRYLVLPGSVLYMKFTIGLDRYLISKKSGITNNIHQNFAKIRIDSYNYLPVEKTLTFHNILILTKSVINKTENN